MAITFKNADGTIRSVEYVGKVISLSLNENYKIMSDVWGSADSAVVWDSDKNEPKKVYIRFCDYNWDNNSFGEVDATDEVKAAYREYLVQNKFKTLKAQAERDLAVIERGHTVEVISGRKVKKGTKGKVVGVVMQESGYGYRRSLCQKIGIATSDRTIKTTARNGKTYDRHLDVVWVWAYHCARIDAPKVDLNAVRAEAERRVDVDMKWMKAA